MTVGRSPVAKVLRRAVPVGVVTCVLGFATLQPAGVLADSGPTVYPSVQVTTSLDPARAYNQPQLMVDPQDPNTLAIAGANYNTGTCGAFVSRDGGRTWTNPGGIARPAGYGSCVTSDYGPYLGAAFGADGTLYMVTTASASSCQQCANDLVSDRSTDLGATWQSSIIHKSQSVTFTGVDGTTKTDMEHFSLTRMATDPSNANYVYAGSRHGFAGRICPTCVVGGNFKPRPYVAVSADGGKTWSSPEDIMADIPRSQIEGAFIPSLAVGPDGTVYAFTRETTPPKSSTQPFTPTSPPGSPGAGARKFVSISHDHGKTWKTSTLDASAVPCGGNCDNPIVGTVAPNGNVYAVWAQSPFVNGKAQQNDAVFSASTDGGKTWTKPVTLNDDQSGLDHMFPGISVAPNGRVDVAWYDFRDDHLINPSSTTSTETYYGVYYTYSKDGGRTWAKNVRVTDRPMNKDAGYTQSDQQGLMGPVAIASGNNTTYFAWSDSRAGTVDNPVEDYYFTSASYAGAAAPTTTGETPAWIWGLLGGVSALTLAGLILVAIGAVARSREREADEVRVAH